MDLLRKELGSLKRGKRLTSNGSICCGESQILEALKEKYTEPIEQMLLNEALKHTAVYGTNGLFLLSFVTELLHKKPNLPWFKQVSAFDKALEGVLNYKEAFRVTIESLVEMLEKDLKNKVRTSTDLNSLCFLAVECFLKSLPCPNLSKLSTRVKVIQEPCFSLKPFEVFQGLLVESNLQVSHRPFKAVAFNESLPETLGEAFSYNLLNSYQEFDYQNTVDQLLFLEVDLVICQKLIPAQLKQTLNVSCKQKSGVVCLERLGQSNMNFLGRVLKSPLLSSFFEVNASNVTEVTISTVTKGYVLFHANNLVSVLHKGTQQDHTELTEALNSSFKVSFIKVLGELFTQKEVITKVSTETDWVSQAFSEAFEPCLVPSFGKAVDSCFKLASQIVRIKYIKT